MGDVERAVRSVRRHPSALLLAAQLVHVLLYPFLEDSVVGRAGLGAVGMVIVIAAVFAVRRTSALTWVAWTLGAPALVLSVLEAVDPNHPTTTVISAAVHVPFYLYVSYAMVKYLFHDEHVTRDELYATGAAFTVVAWAFAYLYSGLQVLDPGSLVGYGGEGARPWFDLLFLSFTTLTNTGLSDIVPVTSHARSVVMVEEVVGVLYIALIISRIVGMGLARHRV